MELLQDLPLSSNVVYQLDRIPILFHEQPTRLPKMMTVILDAGNDRRYWECITVDQEVKGYVIGRGRCPCNVVLVAGMNC